MYLIPFSLFLPAVSPPCVKFPPLLDVQLIELTKKTSTTESENKDWAAKWGPEAQKVIRQTVDDNVARYEYLKQFALEI